MTDINRLILSSLLVGLLGLGACGKETIKSDSTTTPATTPLPMASNAMPADSGTTSALMAGSVATVSLSGANEVPPVSGNASGMMEASFNKDTNVLTWTVTYSGLSGPATAAHFHGPAPVGSNAGVVVPLTGDLTSPVKGNATLTAAQSAEVMAGMWYVNLHTKANPDGELRGQLALRP